VCVCVCVCRKVQHAQILRSAHTLYLCHYFTVPTYAQFIHLSFRSCDSCRRLPEPKHHSFAQFIQFKNNKISLTFKRRSADCLYKDPGRGLCDELIARPEESYRLWCVVCDLETSRITAPYIYIYIYIYMYDISSLRVNDLTLILLTWRKW